MFIRVLCLLLLALNIGAGLWLYFAPSASRNPPGVTDPGVPRLVLLSEIDHGKPVPTAEMASPPETPADLRRDVCASIGPFATQADMRVALNALTPFVSRIQFREVQVNEVLGWWVYLPAPANRELALDMARQLADKDVHDYYVVTAGDQPNTISLGVFRDRVNAEKRRSEVSALGFKPEVTQRSDDIPEYFVDYAQNGAQPVDWRAHLPAGADVHQQSIDCF
ncbi:MAG: SPOR domain-containing protein [Rudaea sp.]